MRQAPEPNEHQAIGLLELVTKQTAVAITRCSRDFRYLWANQAYADWIQRPLDAIVGRHIAEVLGTEAFESVRSHFDRVLAGEHVSYEQELNLPNVGRRWISANYTPLFDDGIASGWVAVVLDITERKRAEFIRFQHAAIVESSQDAIISKNLDAMITSWNQSAQRMFGYTEEEVVGKHITILVPPELLDEENMILARLRSGERIEHYETRRLTKEGKRIDVSLTISPMKDLMGRVTGFSKIARDITERKRTEAALKENERKLIEAQEQERARIGRELHDDITQRLALLAVELEQLRNHPSEVRSRLEALRLETLDICKDVQGLSHELHSSNLRYLGVVAGMKGWCMEFAERQQIEINFSNDVSSAVPLEVGLCLLRVLQEALNNAVKHSGTQRIEVVLTEPSGEIHLIVNDSGAGFDMETAQHGRGLGLISMQERVRLVHGSIVINSRPMSGTTIHVSVPLSSEKADQRALVT